MLKPVPAALVCVFIPRLPFPLPHRLPRRRFAPWLRPLPTCSRGSSSRGCLQRVMSSDCHCEACGCGVHASIGMLTAGLCPVGWVLPCAAQRARYWSTRPHFGLFLPAYIIAFLPLRRAGFTMNSARLVSRDIPIPQTTPRAVSPTPFQCIFRLLHGKLPSRWRSHGERPSHLPRARMDAVLQSHAHSRKRRQYPALLHTHPLPAHPNSRIISPCCACRRRCR